MATRPLIHGDSILKTLQRIAMENPTLLGAPILPERAVDKALNENTGKLEKVMSRLHLLHYHEALTLLRNSISISKLLYTLPTSE